MTELTQTANMNRCDGDAIESNLDYKLINNFLYKIGELKHLNREGWVIRKIEKPETVAGHQYRMAIMAMILFENEPNVDVNKVIKLALIHDMSECIVGDITPYDNVSQEEKHRRELKALVSLSKMLPSDAGDRLVRWFEEYEDRETIESKLTKQLDVLDAVLQAHEYEKQDCEKNGQLMVDMNHFFVDDYLNKIEHPKLKGLLDQLLEDRKLFLSMVNNNVIKFEAKQFY